LFTPEVTFAVKLAVGAGIWLTLINTVWYDKLVAYALLAFRTIDQLPTPNVYTGLWVVVHQTCVLLPVTFRNDQFHAVSLLDASVNWIACGVTPPVELTVKLAFVLFQTVIYAVLVLYPPELLAFNITV
jgi:hypothetical protein